jgi:SOS-response transcriptional repressor LexA
MSSTVGKNIKQYRKKAGLTQVELARKATISRSYLGDVENDRYKPSLDVLERIAKALNTSSAILLDGENSMIFDTETDKQNLINQIISNLKLLSDDEGYFFDEIQKDLFYAIDDNLYMATAFHNSSDHEIIANRFREYFKSPEDFRYQIHEFKEEYNESYNYRTLKHVLVDNNEEDLDAFLKSLLQLVKPYFGEELTITNQIKVPVLGSIAAGQPIERAEYIEGYELVELELVRGRKTYGLKVKGDSMIGDGIYDGDTVIVVKQEEVTSSDIAVVAVNGHAATLKRVKCENGMCMLMPSNSTMQPILVPARDVHVLGKVIQSRRNFE